MDRTREALRSYRSLIVGLAFFEITHVLGLVSMLSLLLPGLDPSLTAAVRMAYVSEHPWLWRLGWLPWQLCAASDVWVAVALLRWTGAVGAQSARRWAQLGITCLLLAIIPEQLSELRLVTDFVSLHALPLWREQLGRYMWLTGTWANSAYTLMTLCWLLSLRSATRAAFGWLEAAVLLAFSAASVANHAAWSLSTGAENALAFQLASAFNGVAFPGLLVLAAAMAMRAGSLHAHGVVDVHRAPLWPRAGSRIGAMCSELAGSNGLRDLVRSMLAPLPFPKLRSDVGDVVYLSWMVNADALQARLGSSVKLQRFGDQSVLSILVYRHGHFGPAFLGPLRELLPSPIQCNVRAYVAEPLGHVAFLDTSIDNALYFVGARLLSDGLPVHLSACAKLERSGSRIELAVDGGAGHAMSVQATLEEASEQSLPADFAQHFTSFQHAVAYLVPQNAAVRVLPAQQARVETSIVIETLLDRARALRCVSGTRVDAIADLVGTTQPLAFVLPRVTFYVTGERLLQQ